MNLEKFTDRAKGFLQSAQTVAIRLNHQRIAPEHLLKALLEDNEGMCAGLIGAAGGDAALAGREADAALAKIPAVSGSGANQPPGLDNDLVRVLDQAEQIASKAGDSFVTVERLLLALTLATTTEAGKALAKAGLSTEGLNAAINALRKGKTADTASAEDRYDALTKFARDLTQAARDGKLDPVIGRDEQPRADRRPRRWQNRHCRRAGAAHREWRCARHAERPHIDGARHGRADCGREISR
jgi:ATP-dependent Clp protease ATP-binding subunit ClpB